MNRPLLTLLTVLGAVFASAAPVRAQFNGPADTAADTVNARHVITTDPAILYPAKHDIVLHGGDQVKVSLYSISDYNTTARISEEGFLTVPLIEPVQLESLTVRQAQTLIAQKLSDAQMFRDPVVQVELLESTKSQITIIGDTHASLPGVTGSRKLLNVLAQAGGLQPTSSKLISIDRPGSTESINVDLGTDPERSKFADIPIYPGDTIVTSKIGNYFLVGAWKSQGQFPLLNTSPRTLLQAYSIANGKFLEGKSNDLHLIRTVGTTRTLTIIHMDDVLKGKAPDPVLEADDILYLPSNKILAAIRGGGVSTAIGLALTLTYAFRY